MARSALECQPLSHHSDFDTGSESGFSELSYIRPAGLKKRNKRAKPVADAGTRVVRRGARITRRHENDAFLVTLSGITEADNEELCSMEYPGVSPNSTFTKLFEDSNLRAIWDKFIQLSDLEQTRLLQSIRRRRHAEAGELEDSDLDFGSDFDSSPWAEPKPRHRVRRATRKHTKESAHLFQHHPELMGSSNNDGTVTVDQPAREPIQVELRGCLPPRFLSLLSRSVDVAQGHHRRQGRKTRQIVTPTDFCLIDRVEAELRRWFDSSGSWANQMDDLGYLIEDGQLKWTPTASLLTGTDLRKHLADGKPIPELLRLTTFERLLLHFVASYLKLSSYSTWSDQLNERQLWVEQPDGHPFAPPTRTLVAVLRSHFVS